MKKLLRSSGVYLLLSILIVLPISGDTSAATSSGSGQGNGYKISPVRTDLVINPGANQDVTVFIQNISSASENLQVIVNDFQARNDETGAPDLLLNGTQSTKHGLKQYVKVLTPNFQLAPNEQKSVVVNVAIPANAPGGGYYGAIRVAPASAVGDKNVNLAASVGALVLVKVPGYITDQLSITSFEVSSASGVSTFFLSGKDLKADVRFQNSGNIQEEPFGKIQLKKGSKVVDSYEINNGEPRGNVLPNSIRKFSTKLNNVGSFGKYTLIGSFGYGATGQLVSAKTSFYVIPLAIILVALFVLLLVLFAIFGLPRIIRKYNQGILRRAGRR